MLYVLRGGQDTDPRGEGALYILRHGKKERSEGRGERRWEEVKGGGRG